MMVMKYVRINVSAVIAAFPIIVNLVCSLARARDMGNTVVWFQNVKCVSSGVDDIAMVTRPGSGALGVLFYDDSTLTIFLSFTSSSFIDAWVSKYTWEKCIVFTLHHSLTFFS